jgi:glutamyl-tRNA synthetase
MKKLTNILAKHQFYSSIYIVVSNMVYNTRIAPSPTGFIHLGNIRTAYHNWLAARSTGGRFILRIDDTDKARSEEQYVDKIYETFDWLGLDFDLTFRQSSRLDFYKNLAYKLIGAGFAEEIEGGAIRLIVNYDIPGYWTDIIAGNVNTSTKDLEVLKNIIIIRSDQNPTYNFASIVDDMTTDINLIIRGTDHISNTIKQIAIIEAFKQLNTPSTDVLFNRKMDFAHVGLVFEKGKKLSKRDGSSNFDTHKNNGTDPDAILNWILRLGWSPSDANFDAKTPLISKDRAKEIFWTDGALRNSSASLDMNKLAFYDKKYKNLKK